MEGIAVGTPLQQICREPGMPAWRTVYDWMDADATFAANIARARDLGADAIAEESMRIVDAAPERGPTGAIDPASVAHAKLRAEHRLKLLAKWNPKKYGDKLEIQGSISHEKLSDDDLKSRLKDLGVEIVDIVVKPGGADDADA